MWSVPHNRALERSWFQTWCPKSFSALLTSWISKRFNLMLPNIILILIRFHYFARSSLYSTERCTVQSFGRSTGAQSLSSPVAQSPCCSVRITLKRTTGRLQHASWKKWLEHVLSKPRQKEESLHLSFPLPKLPGVATRGMFARWSTTCFWFPLSVDLLHKLTYSKQYNFVLSRNTVYFIQCLF
jgi:hypothetical protein